MLFGRDCICAVVAASTAKGMNRLLRRALRHTRIVELRLDWLKNARERDAIVRRLARDRRPFTRIVTLRRRVAGGRFPGGIRAQVELLHSALRRGFDWYDIEIETAESYGERFGKARRLISFHDFRHTPKDLHAVVRRLERCGGDAIKVATQCNSIADSLRVLALARQNRRVVAVPMGDAGLPARVLALREGSALAYAAAEGKTAPGQVSLAEMKQLYRADRLNRRTRVYGVIGDPVRHSLSPLMHNVAFQARRINAVYLPFLVRELRDFLSAIGPLGIAGFSVTLPHKERIIRYLNDCDPVADAIGAVNTVVVRGRKKLFGYNTDYIGVLRSLERRMRLHGSRVLLYGAGGAARAAAFALALAGAAVCVCARRKNAARALAQAVGGEALDRALLRRESFDAIINATPVGMFPDVRRSPLESAELNCRVVMDLVYRPLKTKLLRLAEDRGLATISGAEMFLWQGIAQWEIWIGTRAPEAVMRRAVFGALRSESHLKRSS